MVPPIVSGSQTIKACKSDEGQGDASDPSVDFGILWPLIFSDGVNPAKFVQKIKNFPESKACL